MWRKSKNPFLRHRQLYSLQKSRKRLRIYCKRSSNYELEITLPKGIIKKVIGLIKDEIGGKITALKRKT